MQPVETVSFWRRRVFESIANGRDLHHIIWDIDYGIWCDAQKRTAELLKEYVPDGSSLLDVGCGYGALYECLQRTDTPVPQNIEYTGLDLSPDLLELAKYRHPDLRFVLGNARRTDFDDKQFNWAVCRSFETMINDNTGNWQEIEKELKRVAHHVLVIEFDKEKAHKVL